MSWGRLPIGAPLIELGDCASTNDELAARAAAGAGHGTVVVAERQSAGRGRGGHEWHSPSGNLYMSLLLRPALEAAAVPPLALVAGIAVVRAARRFGIDAALEWPNDVVVGGRKLAGTLAESSSRGGDIDHVIIGIGVNVATTSFPGELAAIATSLALECAAPPDRLELLSAIVAELGAPLAAYADGGVGAIASEWIALARDLGRVARAEVGGRTVRGTVRGLTREGYLELEIAGGERVAVVAGDVVIE